MNKTVVADGGLWLWTSHRVSRDVVVRAFDKHGLAHLIPQADKMAAIQEAAKQICDACGLHEGGRIRPFPLSGDKDAVAVEIRRLIKGRSRNVLPFLFSLGVYVNNDGTHEVKVLECDAHECAEVDGNKGYVEQAATQLYREACDFLTANDLTQAVVALAKRQHGVLMRDGGGVYAVTADKCEEYEQIAQDLAPHGPSLVLLKWDPSMNPGMIGDMCQRAQKFMDETASDLLQEVTDLHSRGAKPRSNGQQTRLARLIEAEQLAEHLKKSFGVAFTSSCKALQTARQAIGEAGIAMMRQSA
jgi:hypothetical protein